MSRTTFYRHFRDKYDLVNGTYEHYKDVLHKRGPEHEVFRLSLGYLLEYMHEKQNLFLRALRYVAQNSLVEAMLEIVNTYMLACYENSKGMQNVTDSERRMVLYHAAGNAALIRRWLETGCPVEPQKLADELCTFLPEELKSTLV